MGKQKRTRKFAVQKKMISASDPRVNAAKSGEVKSSKYGTKKSSSSKKEEPLVEAPRSSSSMFFSHNDALGPPYHVLIDTNFINFSIQNKLDVHNSLLDCLLAKCTGYITSCVMAELEKLGPKFRVALKIAKDKRFVQLPCSHRGTYADDCLVQRVQAHRCFIVATCDRDLKRRLRKIPGVPILSIKERKYQVERLAEGQW